MIESLWYLRERVYIIIRGPGGTRPPLQLSLPQLWMNCFAVFVQTSMHHYLKDGRYKTAPTIVVASIMDELFCGICANEYASLFEGRAVQDRPYNCRCLNYG